MVDEIITARQVCERDRAKSLKAWFLKACQGTRGLATPYTGRTDENALAVLAYVNTGRWLAHCTTPGCHGVEYVRPDEPIFYCLSCGNRLTGGAAVPVKFPEDRERVEAALLKRPIILGPGATLIQQVYGSKARGLPRSWEPGQTAAELEAENEAAGL